jgi:hypothetical protein
MLTFKEFLLAEYDQAAMGAQPGSMPAAGGSQSNIVSAQLKSLQAKQQALLKQKADAQAKFDSDMQRAQVGINSLSEDNPAAQPTSTNPAAQPTSTTNTNPDNPQMLAWKQKQQAALKIKATGVKQIDDELKRNQGQIDALSKQALKQGPQGTQPSPQAPVTGMGTMARSNNPEKTATPSGNKTTQSIAPSSRIGFGTSFG